MMRKTNIWFGKELKCVMSVKKVNEACEWFTVGRCCKRIRSCILRSAVTGGEKRRKI